MPPLPDPAVDPFVLVGRVVVMDDAWTVLPRGAVCIQAGRIVAVQPAAAPRPPAFAEAPAIETHGTIYPGLIELHNHLSYDVLPLWAVPQQYHNRDTWAAGDTYRKLISGPMQVLGTTPGLPEAVVRYVEAKCLLAGTTTSQGIALYSNAGIARYYQGLVRNVEQTQEANLPEAATKISDVEAVDAAAFKARLARASCLLLHLAEGTDPAAHAHFDALHLTDGTWAIGPSLAGIHCLALDRADFDVMAANGGAMVWSPLSNLLLYGKAAQAADAAAAGVRIGIGSDWSPSGSKNVLSELKVAWVAGQAAGTIGAREVVAMATREAARVVGWSGAVGTLAAGTWADLVVVDGVQGDPYEHLVRAHETDLALVMIAGIARAGRPSLMHAFGWIDPLESITVGTRRRLLNLSARYGGDPIVGGLTLAAAVGRLQPAMQDLAQLALVLEHPPPVPAAAPRAGAPVWSLALDHDEMPGMALRPHLPGPDGSPTAMLPLDLAPAASKPLSQILGPIDLDPLTVADDADYVDALLAERNLPPDIVAALRGLV